MFTQILTRDFTETHPGISIDLRLTDRYVDLAAEGFDLALRIGVLADSSLIARRIGRTEAIAVASPAYLAAHGRPRHPDELRDHANIRDSNSATSHRATFVIEGKAISVPLPGRITINSPQAVRRLALEGGGIAIIPRFVVARDLAEGRLERVLSGFPGPQLDIQALYLPQPFIPPRLSAYLAHLREHLSPALGKEPPPDS